MSVKLTCKKAVHYCRHDLGGVDGAYYYAWRNGALFMYNPLTKAVWQRYGLYNASTWTALSKNRQCKREDVPVEVPRELLS